MGLAIVILMVRPVLADDFVAADKSIAKLLRENTSLSDLFADIEIKPIGNDKAFVFFKKESMRYAIVAVPDKLNIDMTRVAEQLCRAKLMTPEADQVEQNLTEKTKDNILITAVLQIWQSSGQIKNAKTTTQKLHDQGNIVSICKARDSDITVTFTSIDKDILLRGEMMIARQLYKNNAYDELINRMKKYLDDSYIPEAKAYMSLAFLKQKDYEQAFVIDEAFDREALTDPWLKDEYEKVFDQSINDYFIISLEDN